MQTCLEEEMHRFRSSGMLRRFPPPRADALYNLSGDISHEQLAHMSSPSAFFPPSDLFEFIPAEKAACLRVGGHVGREGVNLLLL